MYVHPKMAWPPATYDVITNYILYPVIAEIPAKFSFALPFVWTRDIIYSYKFFNENFISILLG